MTHNESDKLEYDTPTDDILKDDTLKNDTPTDAKPVTDTAPEGLEPVADDPMPSWHKMAGTKFFREQVGTIAVLPIGSIVGQVHWSVMLSESSCRWDKPIGPDLPHLRISSIRLRLYCLPPGVAISPC